MKTHELYRDGNADGATGACMESAIAKAAGSVRSI
jgi:hypothetical protein